MNHREKIDISAWERAELFQEFINMRTSVYGRYLNSHQ